MEEYELPCIPLRHCNRVAILTEGMAASYQYGRVMIHCVALHHYATMHFSLKEQIFHLNR